MQIEYDYSSVPTIKKFSKSDKFMRGLMGPFGSGKSSGCVIEIIRRGQAQVPGPDGVRRTRWAAIRNTYQQLEDTTIKTFLNWVPDQHFGTYYKQGHRYVINRFPGVEIEILFRALDRPDQDDNLLSLELTGAWVNEAREVPWSIVDALQGRVGRYPAVKDGGCTWHGVFMDTNPPDEDSNWFKYFEESGADNCAIFKQPSGLDEHAENLIHLPAGYYENLRKGKSDDWVKVYVRGEYGFVRDGKAIYPEYNDNIHCKEVNPIKDKPIRRGWDFGLTPACTFSQLLPSGQWIIFDELTAIELGVDRFSNVVLAYCQEKYIGHTFLDFGDPAGDQRGQTDERTCFEILKTKGVDINPGEVSDTLRIEAVRKPLNTMINGQPALLLHPRCKMLRKGFIGGYQYRRLMTSQEKYTDKPDKNEYSHPHDALQYDASMLFGKSLTSKPKKHEPLVIDTSYIV
jgi:hypothetical protein